MRPEVLFPSLYGLVLLAVLVFWLLERRRLSKGGEKHLEFDLAGAPDLYHDLLSLGVQTKKVLQSEAQGRDLVGTDALGRMWVSSSWSEQVSPAVFRTIVLRAFVENGGLKRWQWSGTMIAWELGLSAVILMLVLMIPGGITSWVFWAILLLFLHPLEKFGGVLLRKIHADAFALDRTKSARAVVLGWGKLEKDWHGLGLGPRINSRALDSWSWRLRWSLLGRRATRHSGHVDISSEEVRRTLKQRPLSVIEVASAREFRQ